MHTYIHIHMRAVSKSSESSEAELLVGCLEATQWRFRGGIAVAANGVQ